MKVIDRLFERLGATYGADWDRSLGNAPLADVKTVWCHELSGFSGQLEALAWALENLPERVPNVIEFRALCRKAPTPEAQRLPEPKADPERVKAELAKLAPTMGAMRSSHGAVDHKAWAKRIMALHEDGVKLNPTRLRFAREALGIAAPSFASN